MVATTGSVQDTAFREMRDGISLIRSGMQIILTHRCNDSKKSPSAVACHVELPNA
jgi:hypothetical protein